eukprot:350146-Chlamydomonas_euryale.AAC.3
MYAYETVLDPRRTKLEQTIRWPSAQARGWSSSPSTHPTRACPCAGMNGSVAEPYPFQTYRRTASSKHIHTSTHPHVNVPKCGMSRSVAEPHACKIWKSLRAGSQCKECRGGVGEIYPNPKSLTPNPKP